MASGFGKYARELLSRLHQSNKYHVAELAAYGHLPNQEDNRPTKVPWKFYANAVYPDDSRHQQYNSNVANQWGLWRFDRVCLDFKATYVLSWRDPWHDEWIKNSPLRPYFNWIYMPTVDSAPQMEKWLSTFLDCNLVLSYSDFGLETLKNESNNHINLFKTARPGVDLEIFKPALNKREHKKKLGFDDVNLVGFVSRNQARKLIPDLLKAFKLFLERTDKKTASKTYLYLHTSYPDNGFDIPSLIKQTQLGHKILTTYVCRSCHNVFPYHFADAKAVCPQCNSVNAGLSMVSKGCSEHQLSEIYKLFDVYLQYAVAEGAGMGQAEAAACGVPIMSIDYSAMSDYVRKLGGTPLKVKGMFRDMGTGADRAYPDNEYLADKLVEFFRLPQQLRQKKGIRARKGAEDYFNWNDTAQVWMEAIDKINKPKKGWYDSPIYLNIPNKMPENFTNLELADWIFSKVLGRPDLIDTYDHMEILRELNIGGYPIYDVGQQRTKWKSVTAENIFKKYREKANAQNIMEKARVGLLELRDEDYLLFANRE